MDKRIYQIALSILPNIGPKRAKTLVSYTGGAEAIFKEKISALSAIDGIGTVRAQQLDRNKSLIRAEEELNFIEKNGITTHYYLDKNFPSRLKFCEDSPIVLFSKGTINFDLPALSVVGTRKATAYGKQLTNDLISTIATTGAQIVSGLAHGIDKHAHEGALKNDLPTIAVLGHGLDLIYPAAHKSLAQKILHKGGLVTEFLSNTPGDPGNFPKRNRIVAGISDATVVIESAEKGGSLITARLANDYNRDVFAFPGNTNQPFSKGCNQLIKQDKAHLIDSGQDIIDYMGWDATKREKNLATDLFNSMTNDESKIVSLMDRKSSCHIDFLADKTRMPADEISLHLFNLEMKGSIISLPGKCYKIA